METSIHQLTQKPLGWGAFIDLTIPEDRCLAGSSRVIRDVLAIHLSPETMRASLMMKENVSVGTKCMRTDAGPCVAFLHLKVNDVLIGAAFFDPGCKAFADRVRRIRSRGYLDLCGYELHGRFFAETLKLPENKFFQCALQVHKSSRGVAPATFERAVNEVKIHLQTPGDLIVDGQWVRPSPRSAGTAFALSRVVNSAGKEARVSPDPSRNIKLRGNI
jgi:hypothetical protein